MSDFKVHILGCGSALPTAAHYPTSQVVELRDKLFMIDCGEGAQRQLRLQRLDFGRLVAIFISHLHGDHSFGLPGLLSTLGLLGRRRALPIYGPKGLDTFLTPFIEQNKQYLGYEIEIHVLDDRTPVVAYEDRSVLVTTLPLKHGLPCMGYHLQERVTMRHIDRASCDFYGVPRSYYAMLREGKDFETEEGTIIPNSRLTEAGKPARSYAYCSDTAYNPSLIPLVRCVDLLYHEATFLQDRSARARETGHSTAEQAALIARDAEVRQLLIGHYSARYPDPAPLLREAQAIFPQTLAANEGMTLSL